MVVSLELGGAIGTVRDKIFASCGSEVKGFTKKGKMFLQFETNLAESIQVILCLTLALLSILFLCLCCNYALTATLTV